MKKRKEQEALLVSKEDAYLHAATAAARDVSAGVPHLVSWGKARIASTPLSIYDINGTLLFYDFDVMEGRGQKGTIRTAANKWLGNPAVSIRLGEKKWNAREGKAKILANFKKKYRKYKITKSLLVCYSYPKIGLMLTVRSEKETKNMIFDIADYSLIPEKKIGKEGAYAWSLLDTMDNKKRSANLRKFSKYDDGRKKLEKRLSGNLVAKKYSLSKLAEIIKFRIRIKIAKELQFCTHYNYNEAASHHCFVLHAQQVNDYCAVATCQMILCYYRYYYSQNQVAPACGYNAGGGCPPDSSPGYESLSNNHINATYDTSATWEEARDQINLLQPMKSGIPGHARACAGYSSVLQFFPFSITEKKLLIYDPWPWNADYKAGGDIYWESWDSVTHTNFVYTELDY